jgi:anti-sigma factor RsiW
MIGKDDDAALSALLDDALPPEEAERLRARLAAEPALLARFEAIQLADTGVREAYAGVADEPLPQRVLDLLDAAETASGDDTDGGTLSIIASNRRRATPGLRRSST